MALQVSLGASLKTIESEVDGWNWADNDTFHESHKKVLVCLDNLLQSKEAAAATSDINALRTRCNAIASIVSTNGINPQTKLAKTTQEIAAINGLLTKIKGTLVQKLSGKEFPKTLVCIQTCLVQIQCAEGFSNKFKRELSSFNACKHRFTDPNFVSRLAYFGAVKLGPNWMPEILLGDKLKNYPSASEMQGYFDRDKQLSAKALENVEQHWFDTKRGMVDVIQFVNKMVKECSILKSEDLPFLLPPLQEWFKTFPTKQVEPADPVKATLLQDCVTAALQTIRAKDEFSAKYKDEFSSIKKCQHHFTGSNAATVISRLAFFGWAAKECKPDKMPEIFKMAKNFRTKGFDFSISKPQIMAKVLEGGSLLVNTDQGKVDAVAYVRKVIDQSSTLKSSDTNKYLAKVQDCFYLVAAYHTPYHNTLRCIGITLARIRAGIYSEAMQKEFSDYRFCQQRFVGNEAVGFISRMAYYGWDGFAFKTKYRPEIFSDDFVDKLNSAACELFLSPAFFDSKFTGKLIEGNEEHWVNTFSMGKVDAIKFMRDMIGANSKLNADKIPTLLAVIEQGLTSLSANSSSEKKSDAMDTKSDKAN